MNRYPLWRYFSILFLIGLAVVFALPNIYPKDPALQISALRAAEVGELTELLTQQALETAQIPFKSMKMIENRLTVRFFDIDAQLKAQPVISDELGTNYIVALNLASATPNWLQRLKAEPMSLGLDLRGGVYFLISVDMPAALLKAENRYISDLKSSLREEKIRYLSVVRRSDGGLLLRFKNSDLRAQAATVIGQDFPELAIESLVENGQVQLLARLNEQAILQIRKFALQQNITTLRKRVNELGVAEPVIQQQGKDRIIVQLPGVQDTARAKEILGATATLEFRLVDTEHDPQQVVNGGRVPLGTKLYTERNGTPVLLKKQVMLSGDHIINAASGIDSLSGKPDVTITLDGKGAKIFSKATRKAIKKPLAVVFIENKVDRINEDGVIQKKHITVEEIINIATIQEELSKRFHITGLSSTQEARNLALLLRAGALAAPIEIIEERTVGPSLGQDNINRGFISIKIGFLLVLVFMVIYYRVFGFIANVALTLNLVFIVALLSLLQATLTLPGIAGIVLTVGMAVDANVLIFERIREEIRNGNSPQASIYAGYKKALSTISDANITTLIAALMLFSFGTGPIKGFAVTLSLGILCSMFTAIIVTRGLVNLIYGGRRLQRLRI